MLKYLHIVRKREGEYNINIICLLLTTHYIPRVDAAWDCLSGLNGAAALSWRDSRVARDPLPACSMMHLKSTSDKHVCAGAHMTHSHYKHTFRTYTITQSNTHTHTTNTVIHEMRYSTHTQRCIVTPIPH
jgi:hypothetical protein